MGIVLSIWWFTLYPLARGEGLFCLLAKHRLLADVAAMDFDEVGLSRFRVFLRRNSRARVRALATRLS